MKKAIRKTGLSILVCLIIFILITSTGFCQDNANTRIFSHKATPFSDKLGYTVDLFLSVLDGSGMPITGLTADNFTVYEDSNPVKLNSLTPVSNQPSNVVLLIDSSGTMTGQSIIDIRSAAERFLSKLNQGDQYAIMDFNETVTTDQSFTDDIKSGNDILDAVKPVNGKGSCLYDAAYKAIELAMTGSNPQKAVIIPTDGGDTLANGSVCSKKTLDDVINLAESGQIAIYTMGFGDKTDPKALEKMAESSNGQYFSSATTNNSSDLFDAVSAQLKNTYQLSYTSSAAAGNHSLVVETNISGKKEQTAYSVTLPATPTILTFSAPEEGASLSGKVLLSASFISESQPVSSVEFAANGTIVCKAVSKPYECEWDTASLVPQDSVALEAVAYAKDGTELARTSETISVTAPVTETAPEITFASPAEGSEQYKSVDLKVSIIPDDSVNNVEFYNDGKFIGKVASKPFEYNWDISNLSEGNIKIEAVALGKNGQELTRKSTSFLIKAPEKQPFFQTLLQKVPLYVLAIAAAVLIGLIILIIALAKKKTKKQNYASAGNDPGATLDQFSLAGNNSGAVLATLEVTASDDPDIIGNVFNITHLPMTLGRSAENDIVFSKNDQAVSRHQAVLDALNDTIAIRDAGSKFGTFINDKQIGSELTPLTSDDEIRLGPRTKLTYKRSVSAADGSDNATIDGFNLNQ